MTGDDFSDLPRAWGLLTVPDFLPLATHVVPVAPRPHCPACGVHGDAEVLSDSVRTGQAVIRFPACGHAWAIVTELAPEPE